MITYEDKVALYENTDIANVNKVTAGDMNEIKKSVNGIVENNIFKNLFSNNYMVLANLTYSNGTYTQKTADTSTDVSWKIQAFNNDSYVKILNTLTSNELSRKSMNFTKDNTFNNINFGLNGSSKDSIIKINVSDLEDGKTYTISWNLLNNVQGSIAWNEIQIEESPTPTPYTPWAGYIVESGSNDNGRWIKFSDGTMMCRGIVTTGDVTFTAWGSLYQYEVPSVSFPSSFIDVPHIDFTSNNPSTEYNYCLEAGTYQTTKSETGIMRVVRPLATTGRIQIKWTAIGKWK